jgi:hypothetical protein
MFVVGKFPLVEVRQSAQQRRTAAPVIKRSWSTILQHQRYNHDADSS